MTDNERATIGGNKPPEEPKWPAKVAAILEPWASMIDEAEQWLDGEPVENEAQAKAVDEMLKAVKAADKALGEARDAATKPLNEAWKNEVAYWKPHVEDLDRIKKGLAAIGTAYKNKLAAEKEEARQKAAAEAARKRRELEEAERRADAGNLESQRELAAAKEQFQEARKAASAANQDKVTGLRTVWHFEVEDRRALLNWIAKNDPAPLADFLTEYARKNHRTSQLAGVRSWSTKEGW